VTYFFQERDEKYKVAIFVLSEDDRKQDKTALRQIRVICSARFKKITPFISGFLIRI